VLLAVVLACLCVAPASALADPPPAVQQYTETVPSGAGPQVQGAAREKGDKLSTKAQRRLTEQGGSDAAALKQIATSAGLGAPAASNTTKPRSTPQSHGKDVTAAPSRNRGAVGASGVTLSSASSGSDIKIFVIGGLLLLAALAAAAAWRFRRGSPGSAA